MACISGNVIAKYYNIVFSLQTEHMSQPSGNEDKLVTNHGNKSNQMHRVPPLGAKFLNA